MFIGNQKQLTRRAFLRRSGQLATVGAASSFALGLSGLSDLAAAETSSDDYKAIVCVFLKGGNDHANTLIPFDATNYNRYASIRGAGTNPIAISRSALSKTQLHLPEQETLTDDMQLALAPGMANLKALYDHGKVAPVLNVGPLIAPLSRAQFEHSNTAKYPRPKKLFSHNDQEAMWQSFQPEGEASGWGGRIGDLALSTNKNSMFTAINAKGHAVFLSGEDAAPYRITKNGAVSFGATKNLYGVPQNGSAAEQILKLANGGTLGADYTSLCQRSLEYGNFVNDALSQTKLNASFPTNSSIADQLAVVARMIGSRKNLGVKRQIFFVSMSGFDTHDNVAGEHQALLSELDQAIGAFWNSMLELGLSEQVTTFTASEFGRTLSSNGDGTDHGWGGHHFVIGGAVNGGRFYGKAPKISLNSDDQVGQGRLLPTIAVDQVATTLGAWFGVPISSLSYIAPNISNFQTANLGFMDLET